MIKILIVDDHKVVIDGISLLLSQSDHVEVVGFALNGKDAIDMLEDIEVDLILLDINMPIMNGIDACKVIKNTYADIKVIALSMLKESSLIKMMLKNGATGYVLKNAGKDELLDAITKVNDGKKYLGDEVNDIILDSLTKGNSKKTTNPFPSLSRREKEILELIMEEYTTQEISKKLFISFGTVETHRRNMLIKLGARNTAGLVRIAMEYELV